MAREHSDTPRITIYGLRARMTVIYRPNVHRHRLGRLGSSDLRFTRFTPPAAH